MKTAVHWEKIGLRPHHGICVPLFSLRTKNSPAIGEFLDLLPLLDWCKQVKFDCLQLLPLNDTGDDPSPYNPLSAFALDPVYLSLHALAGAHPLPDYKGLNRAQVKQAKLDWLKAYFQNKFSPSPLYLSFVKQNKWLETYALFMAIRDKFHKAHFQSWPEPYKTARLAHAKEFENELDFHRFVQFLCFSQLQKVKAHAEQSQIFLKGDLQFLLSSNSADVWANPSLFDLSFTVGAPPDAFNPKGQNWGFPLFNWDAMRKNHYAWCKERMKTLEQFFHIYRIDHVVGFFRTWAIDLNESEGKFVPSDPKEWDKQGREILEVLISSTSMLPIAEDLGMIPPEVFSTLKEFGICSTKVVPWQKEEGQYVPFSLYEPFSLTTLSTPDTEPFGLWWKSHPHEAVQFASFMGLSYHPVLSKSERETILKAAHHSASYFHIHLLQEYLDLFPELSWNSPSLDRINVPGTVLPTNWTYRFQPALEEILSHQGLQDCLARILP